MGNLRAMDINLVVRNTPISPDEITNIYSLKSGLETSLSSPALVISNAGQNALQDLYQSPSWKLYQGNLHELMLNSHRGNFNLNADAFFNNLSQNIDNIHQIILSEITAMTQKVDNYQQKSLNSAKIAAKPWPPLSKKWGLQ